MTTRQIANGWDPQAGKSNNAVAARMDGLRIKSDICAGWLNNRITVKQAKELIDLGIWEPHEAHHHSGGRYNRRRVYNLISYYSLADLDSILGEGETYENVRDTFLYNRRRENLLAKRELANAYRRGEKKSPVLENNEYGNVGEDLPNGWELGDYTNLPEECRSKISELPELQEGVHFAYYRSGWREEYFGRKKRWKPLLKLILPKEKAKIQTIRESYKRYLESLNPAAST